MHYCSNLLQYIKCLKIVSVLNSVMNATVTLLIPLLSDNTWKLHLLQFIFVIAYENSIIWPNFRLVRTRIIKNHFGFYLKVPTVDTQEIVLLSMFHQTLIISIIRPFCKYKLAGFLTWRLCLDLCKLLV